MLLWPILLSSALQFAALFYRYSYAFASTPCGRGLAMVPFLTMESNVYEGIVHRISIHTAVL